MVAMGYRNIVTVYNKKLHVNGLDDFVKSYLGKE